jgi:hypothetical protein
MIAAITIAVRERLDRSRSEQGAGRCGPAAADRSRLHQAPLQEPHRSASHDAPLYDHRGLAAMIIDMWAIVILRIEAGARDYALAIEKSNGVSLCKPARRSAENRPRRFFAKRSQFSWRGRSELRARGAERTRDGAGFKRTFLSLERLRTDGR